MYESSGVPYWVFWLMLAVILFLAGVILTRDKEVREWFKGIFSHLGKKIHEAKIRLKINREKEKTGELLKELGKKIWEKKIEIDGAGDIREKLESLRSEEERLIRDKKAIEKEIEENIQAHERFRSEQAAAIKEQEQLKAPEEEELHRMKRELSEIEKITGEKEKLKSKNEKKTAAYKKKIDEIQADDDLSRIEKKMQTEELESDIKELNNEIERLTGELAPLYEKRGNPREVIERIKPKILKYDEQIGKLKEEQKERDRQYDNRNREHLKKKGELERKKNRLEQEKETLIEKLGKAGNLNRVENGELSGLYSKIDRVERTIKALERQIR